MCVCVCGGSLLSREAVRQVELLANQAERVAEALRKRNEREESEIKRGRGEQGSLGRLASCCTEPSSNSSTAARN